MYTIPGQPKRMQSVDVAQPLPAIVTPVKNMFPDRRRALGFLALAAWLLVGHRAYSAPHESAASLTAQVRAYRTAHEMAILAEFASLLALPNHATDAGHIRANAEAIVRLFRSRRINTTMLELEGAPPAILAEISVPGAAKTVTFYAHYDGQPVDAKAWSSAPFTPTLRTASLEQAGRPLELSAVRGAFSPDWRLYARSASDDKAPIIGFLAALDALRAVGVTPGVNLKFFLEGEEEIGSPHLAMILDRYAAALRTDLWLLCDGPIDQSGRMQVFFGARGAAALDITVYGPSRALHSGHYGNWAPNPIVLLTHLIDSMRDTDAHILIPGFYDDVRALSGDDQQWMRRADSPDAMLKNAFGIGRSEGAPASLVEQLAKPALNVHGFQSGHVGESAANVIETEARASIDFRLVPDQTPERVRDLVERHIARQGYWIVRAPPDIGLRLQHARVALVEWGAGGYAGQRTSMGLPVSRAVVAVIEQALGTSIVRQPSLGGSIPMHLFAGDRGLPVIGVPIANYDNNQHAANENIRLGNLWMGIEIYASLFANLRSWSL